MQGRGRRLLLSGPWWGLDAVTTEGGIPVDFDAAGQTVLGGGSPLTGLTIGLMAIAGMLLPLKDSLSLASVGQPAA